MALDLDLDLAGLSLMAEDKLVGLFANITRGVERESLRVDESGKIATSSHPKALGSALTQPFITTDFSESLIELVTPPVNTLAELEQSLQSLHQFAYQHLAHELLWPASMPCSIQDHNDIIIAHYGSSNIAKMKQTYRRGLTHRYGKMMQVIAGIHYNFSLPKALFESWHQASGGLASLREFTDAAYFRLMRNYFRHYWILIYLFGASPACAVSSLPAEAPDYLKPWDKHTYFAPYATSLRMSGLGYNNSSQASISISRDNLSAYVKDLLEATRQPYPAYAKAGLKNAKGEYQQLNTNLLQIENEYYSPIRPKQITRSGERPAIALQERGVEYIEVRCLDVNPLLPCGIDIDQAAFVDVFLVFCLLASADPLSKIECQEKRDNLQKVVIEGRRPGLTLQCKGQNVELQTWAESLFQQFERVAKVMDSSLEQPIFSKAVQLQYQKLADSSLTPSAQVLSLMMSQQQNFEQLMLAQAKQFKSYFAEKPLIMAKQQELIDLSRQSWLTQQQIEASDTLSFEQFINNYFAQGL